jgi:hypothetical protein
MNRRRFLGGAAALGASLATGGCAGTYDIAAGLTGSSGGANNSTLVYWNLLTGGTVPTCRPWRPPTPRPIPG